MLKPFSFLFPFLKIPQIINYQPKCQFLQNNLPSSLRKSQDSEMDLNLLTGDLNNPDQDSPPLQELLNSKESISILIGGHGVGYF